MMSKSTLRKLNLVFIFLVVFLSTCSSAPRQVLTETAGPEIPTPSKETSPVPSMVIEATPTAFLPLVTGTPGDVKFFGIYFKQYWTNENVTLHMLPADQAAGKKHASVGWFIDLEDDAFTIPVTDMSANNLVRQLEELWKAGYFSFVNVGTNANAGQIVRGERDKEIGYLAEFYKAWIDKGEGRTAMIAPMQEMNGTWTVYGRDSSSEEYKQAYRYIVDFFQQKGIGDTQVLWVFAPNGWNDPAYPERAFENYYPGDDVVDFVSFSSYNYGFCPATVDVSWVWESYHEIFEPFINRMQAMAPTKPVIIAETATTAYYDRDLSDNQVKDQWLIDTYNHLADNPAVIGVYYFSFGEFDGYKCDFEINPDGVFVNGYKEALKNSSYQYHTIQDLINTGE